MMTVRCSICGGLLVSWESYVCHSCGPAGKPVFDDDVTAAPNAPALKPGVPPSECSSDVNQPTAGKDTQQRGDGDGKAVLAKSSTGYGKMVCPECGEVKSSRWPCKKCSPRAERSSIRISTNLWHATMQSGATRIPR